MIAICMASARLSSSSMSADSAIQSRSAPPRRCRRAAQNTMRTRPGRAGLEGLAQRPDQLGVEGVLLVGAVHGHRHRPSAWLRWSPAWRWRRCRDLHERIGDGVGHGDSLAGYIRNTPKRVSVWCVEAGGDGRPRTSRVWVGSMIPSSTAGRWRNRDPSSRSVPGSGLEVGLVGDGPGFVASLQAVAADGGQHAGGLFAAHDADRLLGQGTGTGARRPGRSCRSCRPRNCRRSAP